MKTTVKIEKEVDIKFLQVDAHAPNPEDATIGGVEDTGGVLPCREGEMWRPLIDFDSGKILNWDLDLKSRVHFQVVDSGSYHLLDERGNKILSIENDYVPRCLCPKENGYGDYIIMDIDENGMIEGWNPTLEGFQNED